MGSTKWQSIWTACGEKLEPQAKSFPKVWRVVEDQSRASTVDIVDTLDDQRILEDILEEKAKPRVPPTFLTYHFLLYTPFRYPPLRYGSRFGSRNEQGIWYGSLDHTTVLAEKSYYLFLFQQDTTAALEPISGILTLFHVGVESQATIDISRPPFDEYRTEFCDPASYEVSQMLGVEMRKAGVSCFTFFSARIDDGMNVGVFHPEVFTSKSVPPSHQEGWLYKATDKLIEYRKKFVNEPIVRFPFDGFLVQGHFPRPNG